MIEVDLNNGMFRKIDFDKPVYCVKCKKEVDDPPKIAGRYTL